MVPLVIVELLTTTLLVLGIGSLATDRGLARLSAYGDTTSGMGFLTTKIMMMW